MHALWKDIAFSFRLLSRSPGITVIAVIVMALGVGLTTTMFSVINGVVLKGLPLETGNRLMHIRTEDRVGEGEGPWLPVRYLGKLRERETGFDSLAAHRGLKSLFISGDGSVGRYALNRVTSNFHEVLGVQPLLGPGFSEGDDRFGAPPKIMISHRIWLNRYGGDPEIIGRVVRANGALTEIVGVMPPGFRFPDDEETWMPAPLDWENPTSWDDSTGESWVVVFGRLRSGVDSDAATASVRGHLRQIREEEPVFTADQEGRADDVIHTVAPFADEFIRPEARRSAYALFGASLLILLIACCNVANLLLAHFAKRSRELAIRGALGATRVGLIRLILTEALLVSLIGGALGAVLMLFGIEFITARILEIDQFFSYSATAAMTLPGWVDFDVDARVVCFVLAVVFFSTLMTGIFPAWRMARTEFAPELNDESRGASGSRVNRVNRTLVVGQIALSVALLVGMGLTMRTAHRLNNVDLNLDPENVLTARVALDEKSHIGKSKETVVAYHKLLDAVEAHPDVVAAASARKMPLAQEYRTRYSGDGVEYPAGFEFPVARYNTVSSGYFETLGVPLLNGRAFERTDTHLRCPVTIVNDLLAERAWPGEDPIGKRIGVHWGQPNWREEAVWHTVVGVVPDLKMNGLGARDGPAPGMYFPLSQFGMNPTDPILNLFVNFLLVRARTDPMALVRHIREQLQQVDPHAAFYWPKTVEQFLDEQLAPFTLAGTLFQIFGLCGLFLASVGLYGVMSYSILQRTREIGVRASLGADRRAIFALIVGDGIRQVAVGLIIGVALAVVLARALNAILYEVSPYDPPTYLIVLSLLCIVALMACYLPARRAANLDPVDALRAE